MSEDWITYMTADDLLERARTERAELAALWQGLTPQQMTRRPGPQPDWSVKDLIAHITWWEQSATNWVSRALSGELLTRTETPDELNARIFADNRDLPLATALDYFAASWRPLEDLLLRLSDEELNDAELCNIREMPLLYFLVGNTFAHYADHVEELRAYVESLLSPQNEGGR
ncbi:MAG: ClbS/DfsB family four-helix bundle protein [Chloroflexi bacterium]|nr:ClbS/DfsB family four-helix bundle protein [Chloroflexota bacterium]MCY3581242.1 ClbS/DfsB family four-helix bundle protein [Chloroflexota bacterium]MCY3714923.1 ClbS/DfsB family four-helix bundle protein [Chloroflexota bacterium]MDE2651934.1 ClbS/DfsB family four-helix bundle protein [Chloroflexota bacterium]MXV93810.1 ClbS/DfsB family four-helix bundle protein [Chloroflexota bacterium]